MSEAPEQRAARVSRPVRILGRALFAGLWLLAAGALLEGAAVGRRVAVESLNRYVIAVKAWPEYWAEVDLTDDGKLLLREGLQRFLNEHIPPDVPAGPAETAGDVFARYSEEDRLLFAELQGEVMAVCDAEGRVVSAYADPVAAEGFGLDPSALPGRRLAELGAPGMPGAGELPARVLSTGTPASLEGTLNGRPTRLSCFPMPASAEVGMRALCAWRDVSQPSLTEVVSAQMDAGDASEWRIPLLEYKRNYRDREGMWYTNNLGFWDNDVVLPKPAGLFRIVCVGGSTTEEGAVKDLSYPNLLEKRLNDHFGGTPRFEVVNAGVVGMDSRGERRRMLDFLAMEPDLIIEYNVINDLCHWIMPRLEEEGGWRLRTLGRSQFLNQYLNGLLWPDDAEFARILDDTRMANLRMMVKAARAKGVPVAFASFAAPDPGKLRREERAYLEWQIRTFWQGKHYGYRTYHRLVQLYNRMLRDHCAAEGLLYLPVGEKYTGDTRDFSDVCHMRPKGIEKKADIFFQELLPSITRMAGEKGTS